MANIHLHVQSCRLVHVSGIHCHMQASSTSGYAFVHFIYCIEYSMLISSVGCPEASVKAMVIPGAAKKHQAIMTETKVKIIERVEQGKKMVDAHSYNTNHSTIGTILKNRDKIMEHVKSALPVIATI